MNFQSSTHLKNNLGQTYSDRDYLSLIYDPLFTKLLIADLKTIQTWQGADKFFEEHTSFIHPFSLTGNQTVGIDLWLNLLETVSQADPASYSQIHKGTPYYHAGIYSLLATKYKEAFEWIDYAFDQDLKINPVVSSPTMWTLSFDPLRGQNDRGKTQNLLTEIDSVLQQLFSYDSSFNMNANHLRGIIKNKVLISGSTRPLRSAWATFLSVLLSHRDIRRYLRISPKSGESQIVAHESLQDLTLILETLIKEIPNFSSFNLRKGKNSTFKDLLEFIIAPRLGYTYNETTNSLITTNMGGDYSTILSEIRTAEAIDDKLAISFTLSYRIRNLSHHTFSEKSITEEIFDCLYLRIIHCILTVLINFY